MIADFNDSDAQASIRCTGTSDLTADSEATAIAIPAGTQEQVHAAPSTPAGSSGTVSGFPGISTQTRSVGGDGAISSSSEPSRLPDAFSSGLSTSQSTEVFDAATYYPAVSVEKMLPSWYYPRGVQWAEIRQWNVISLSAGEHRSLFVSYDRLYYLCSQIYRLTLGIRLALVRTVFINFSSININMFQPLWAPIGILPDPPAFPSWWAYPNVQVFPDHLVGRFLSEYPDHIWAQVILLTDEMCARHELMAPWFGGRELQLHHALMHLYLTGVLLLWSRSNQHAQPGSTFLDQCMPHSLLTYTLHSPAPAATNTRYYFGDIERPALALLRFVSIQVYFHIYNFFVVISTAFSYCAGQTIGGLK